MNDQLSKIEELTGLFERIETLIRDPFNDEISSNREITEVQKKTSSLIAQLDDIIDEFGDRFRIQSNRKKDIFRDAVTIRSQWGSAVIKDVIGELYIIKEKYKKSIPDVDGKTNAVKQFFILFNSEIDPVLIFETFSSLVRTHMGFSKFLVSINTNVESYNSLNEDQYKSVVKRERGKITFIVFSANSMNLSFSLAFQFMSDFVEPNGSSTIMLGSVSKND